MPLPNSKEEEDTSPLSKQEVWTIVLLCLVNVINYMDRFCVAGVLVQIQEFYKIDDVLGGLLQSGFSVSYMLCSPIFGYLGDRYSRRTLLVACILFWSAMTLTGSFAPNYTTFFLVRVMVGVGESGFTTIAPTVLSDIVSSGTRSIVLALFYFAIPVGSGMGYLLSSKICELTNDWHWGLRATPLLGLLSAGGMCFSVDPVRGEKEAASVGGKTPTTTTSYMEDIWYLVKNPSFMLSTAAFTCVSFVIGALSWWAPKCLYYGFTQIPGENKPLESVVFTFGLVTVATGLLGVAFGSGCSKLLRPHLPYVDPIICGVGLLLSAPLIVAALYTAAVNVTHTFILVFFGQLTLNMNWAVVADILLYVVIPTRRSSGEAGQMLVSHAFGDCFSPFLVGLLSEHFKAGSDEDEVIFHALRHSLLITMVVELLGGLFFIINTCFIVQDQKKAQDHVAGTAFE